MRTEANSTAAAIAQDEPGRAARQTVILKTGSCATALVLSVFGDVAQQGCS
jgi:hypothetical protein